MPSTDFQGKRQTQAARRELREGRLAGYTLIEILVTLGVSAVLAGMGLPQLNSFLVTMRAKGATFELVGDLTVARSEALKRNASIQLAPIEGSWSQGWLVVDGETILSERGRLPNDVEIFSSLPGAVTFDPTGRLVGHTSNQTFEVGSADPATKRCVLMTPTGTARTRHGAC